MGVRTAHYCQKNSGQVQLDFTSTAMSNPATKILNEFEDLTQPMAA